MVAQCPRHEDASLVRDDEGRRLVAARAREPHLQTKDGRIDVKDVTGDELLEQVVGAAVAERLERAPEFRRGLQAPDAERCGLGTRLEDPRRRDLASPARDVRVVQRVHERRTRQPRAARAPPHRQLVAEPPRGGLAHAGDEQVLAQHRRQLDVEVVERDDAIDAFGARQVRGTLADVVERHVPTDVVERVDGVARPVGVSELLLGQEQHPAPLPPAFAQELVTLPVGGDAEEGQGHGGGWAFRWRGRGVEVDVEALGVAPEELDDPIAVRRRRR